MRTDRKVRPFLPQIGFVVEGRHGALGRVSHFEHREVALARVVLQGQHARGGGPGDDRPDPRAQASTPRGARARRSTRSYY